MAAFLIGLLSFSVLFQEIHIRLHKVYGHSHEHVCSGDHHFHSEPGETHFTESEHHCLICDYNFAPNKWFTQSILCLEYFEESESFIAGKQPEFHYNVLPSKSSRSPPSAIS
jgi:hypothetical protein